MNSKNLLQILFAILIIAQICVVFFVGCSNKELKDKTEINQENILIPFIASEYIHVYVPGGDVFSGPNTKDLKAGQYYRRWQTNDHCFVKGEDSRWHSFGITRPENQPGKQVKHSGEYASFHAVSPGDMFEYSFREDAWKDTAKVLPPSQRPGENTSNHAPTVVKHEGIYKMIYGPIPFRVAISTDMYNWKPQGALDINEKNGRDPSLTLWEGTYYLTYCSGNVVKTTTSTDLENWSEPVEIYKGEVESYKCESPTLLRHNNTFYLFWCLWDSGISGNGYGERTFVYCSDDPLDFHDKPLVTELAAHAPEIIQGEDGGRWYISSAQYPHRGINVARLEWKMNNRQE